METRWITQDEIPSVLQNESISHTQTNNKKTKGRDMFFHDPERTLATFDSGQMVGTISVNGRAMAVPGSTLPTSAVSTVMVLPTHTRQGIMTCMIDQQIRDAHDRGEVLACLFASDTRIYGRFGFGIPCFVEDWSIKRHNTAFLKPVSNEGSFNLIEPDKAIEHFTKIYDTVWSSRPGMMNRTPRWMKFALADTLDHIGGTTELFHVIYEIGGVEQGYVMYRGINTDQGPGMQIEELLGVDDDATTRLWSFCFNVDLMTSFEIKNRPCDDPLLWTVSNPRGISRSIRDGMWLRLIDVQRALSSRNYSAEEELIIDVRDKFCEWNSGRYKLATGINNAECTRTNDDPDLLISAQDLASVYMGAVQPRSLYRSGRIEATSPDAISRADRMFAWHTQPWWSEWYI